MGAVGRGFRVGVAGCTCIGFCRFSRVVSFVNNIGVSMSRDRVGIVGIACTPCVHSVNVSYPGIAGANVRGLYNKRTLTCSHGQCANDSLRHNSHRGRILVTVFSTIGSIPVASCPDVVGRVLNVYRAALGTSSLVSLTG